MIDKKRKKAKQDSKGSGTWGFISGIHILLKK